MYALMSHIHRSIEQIVGFSTGMMSEIELHLDCTVRQIRCMGWDNNWSELRICQIHLVNVYDLCDTI